MKLKVVGIFTLLALLVASAVCLAEVPVTSQIIWLRTRRIVSN